MGLTKKQRKQSWKLNRTPIVGLKKFRFDARRCGFIMCADRRKRYDDESRREALKLIQTGAGGGSLARRPAMPVQTARQWVLLYGPYCVSWCGAAANFCLMEVIAEPLRNVVAQHVSDARVPRLDEVAHGRDRLHVPVRRVEEREQLPLPYPTATYSGHTFWPLTLV